MTAYQVLKQYGWQQGHFGDKSNGFCLSGAIYEAYRGTGEAGVAFSKVGKYIPKVYNGDIPSWNDKKSRRKYQVLALAKKARV